MSNEAWILIAILAIALLGTIGYRLYKAKKNDGVITKEEVESIADTLREGVVSIIEIATTMEGLKTPEAQRAYVIEQMSKGITGSSILTDREKTLIASHTDKILDFIIETKDRIANKPEEVTTQPTTPVVDAAKPETPQETPKAE